MFGAFKTFFSYRFTSYRTSAWVLKMSDFTVGFLLAVSRISLRKFMYFLYTFIKGKEICYHSIPIVFWKGFCIFLAMFQKITLRQYKFKTFFIAFLRCTVFGFFDFIISITNIQILGKLALRVLPFRVKQNTLDHNRLTFAVIISRQSHNTALVNANRIAAEMLY